MWDVPRGEQTAVGRARAGVWRGRGVNAVISCRSDRERARADTQQKSGRVVQLRRAFDGRWLMFDVSLFGLGVALLVQGGGGLPLHSRAGWTLR
jgi:hypothetical protein